MADKEVPEANVSTLPQQIDPNADLMKARPGGAESVDHVPTGGDAELKPESTFDGPGSEGGYEGGPEKTEIAGA